MIRPDLKKIQAHYDQANLLDYMGFPETATMYRGIAMLAQISKGEAQCTRRPPVIGVIKGRLP